MELGKSPTFLSLSFLTEHGGVIALLTVPTSQVCEGEEDNEHREHPYVGGRIIASKMSPF